jgi:biopolymer transport protein ExbD
MSITVHAAEGDEAELNTTINTTPLVDVMLVLLIIFLITIPVVLKNVPINLPNARNIPTITKPENIVIAVDKDENTYFDNAPVQVNELKDRFVAALRASIAKGAPPPEVHIRGDSDVRFEAIGKVILACQEAGILKVGFLTEPRAEQ